MSYLVNVNARSETACFIYVGVVHRGYGVLWVKTSNVNTGLPRLLSLHSLYAGPCALASD